jgi:DNA-binding phage protein
MMTAMARISGGDTALRRRQADSKQRITSMVKTESYKENLLESFLDDGDMDVFILALRDVAEAQGGMQHFRKYSYE